LLKVVGFDCVPYWSILMIPDFVHVGHALLVYFESGALVGLRVGMAFGISA
jgi:hypothetical protein